MCCLVKLEVTSGWQSLPKYSPGCFPTSMQNKPVQFFEKKVIMFALFCYYFYKQRKNFLEYLKWRVIAMSIKTNIILYNIFSQLYKNK